MGLDVYLYMDVDTGGDEPQRLELFNYGITHNLGQMASSVIYDKHNDDLTLYGVLWRPEEFGYTTAGSIVELLRLGLAKLKSEPDFYKTFNSSNGWGEYEGLVEFVSKYLDSCESNPSALIEVSR